MQRRTRLVIVLGLGLSFAAWLLLSKSGQRLQFLTGGMLVNLGYRMQDHLETYDFQHEDRIEPASVWSEMQSQNQLAAKVREWFPRTPHHPLVALVVCMDARLDTNELTGDTRRYYYVIRTAGSVLAEKEEEMLELAVENGVELVVLTTHSDCAAEKVAAAPEKRKLYPALARAVDERNQRIREFMARPAIVKKIESGQLVVKLMNIDTLTERLLPQEP
jgi:carbonic anhydrase